MLGELVPYLHVKISIANTLIIHYFSKTRRRKLGISWQEKFIYVAAWKISVFQKNLICMWGRCITDFHLMALSTAWKNKIFITYSARQSLLAFLKGLKAHCNISVDVGSRILVPPLSTSTFERTTMALNLREPSEDQKEWGLHIS